MATLARLLVLTVMVKQIGNRGAIISRNMAISLRMSAKSLGEGAEVRGQRWESFSMQDFPCSVPAPPHLHCFALQSSLLLLGNRGCCNLDVRRKHFLQAEWGALAQQLKSDGLRKTQPARHCLHTLSLLS